MDTLTFGNDFKERVLGYPVGQGGVLGYPVVVGGGITVIVTTKEAFPLVLSSSHAGSIPREEHGAAASQRMCARSPGQ